MITLSQSNALINFIDRTVAEIIREIRTADEVYAEAGRHSEYCEMLHLDAQCDREQKIDSWLRLRREAEAIEISNDEPEFPSRHVYLPVERRGARAIV